MSAFVLFGIAVLVGWAVLHRSAQESEASYWTEREKTPQSKRDEHDMVDNAPDQSAIIAVAVIALIVGFILIKMGMFSL